jgi:putative ubiquitin-RnfH superfamily antitoxin RatB of RatAB toxin-antitoxin module
MAEPESEHAPGMITVEVAYALPDQQVLLAFEVEEGTTAREAVERSGILDQHPEIELMKSNKIGVFGKLVKPDQVLREGDRVEIYRPLIADPKEVRRQRAKEGKKTRKGGGEADSAGAEAAGEGDEA